MPGFIIGSHLLTIRPLDMPLNYWLDIIKQREMYLLFSFLQYICSLLLIGTGIIHAVGYRLEKNNETLEILKSLYPSKKERVTEGELKQKLGIDDAVFGSLIQTGKTHYTFQDARLILKRLILLEKKGVSNIGFRIKT